MTFKVSNDHFVNGQNSYARGIGLRAIVDQANVLSNEDKQDESMSLVLGYVDGLCAAIKRIDNMMMFPAGPEK